jgi:BetI-type transcriptional repressor, C-terminal
LRRATLISILVRGRDLGVFRADVDPDLVATSIMACIRGVGTQALAEQIEHWVVGR